MKKEDEEFLDALDDVFNANQDQLIKAFEILDDNPQPDGMLFSKEFRDHMALLDMGDRDMVDVLKDRNFWKHLAKYTGISDEEFEHIGKGDKV